MDNLSELPQEELIKIIESQKKEIETLKEGSKEDKLKQKY